MGGVEPMQKVLSRRQLPKRTPRGTHTGPTGANPNRSLRAVHTGPSRKDSSGLLRGTTKQSPCLRAVHTGSWRKGSICCRKVMYLLLVAAALLVRTGTCAPALKTGDFVRVRRNLPHIPVGHWAYDLWGELQIIGHGRDKTFRVYSPSIDHHSSGNFFDGRETDLELANSSTVNEEDMYNVHQMNKNRRQGPSP